MLKLTEVLADHGLERLTPGNLLECPLEYDFILSVQQGLLCLNGGRGE